MAGRIKVEKKKKKDGKFEGSAFIRAREKRASQLETSTRGKISARGGVRQASRELSGRASAKLAADQREEAQTPEALARKQLEIESALREIETQSSEGELVSEQEKDKGAVTPQGEGFFTEGKNVEDKGGLTAQGEFARRLATGTTEEGEIAGEAAKAARGIAITSVAAIALSAGAEFTIARLTQAGGVKGIPALVAKDKAIQGIANAGGVSVRTAGNIYARINNTPVQRMLALLGSTPAKITGGVMGSSALFTWFGADNIASAQPFFLRNALNDLRRGTISPEQAQELAQSSQNQMDIARTFIDFNTRINPILMPFRNLLMSGLNGKQEELDLIKFDILNV